jgi:hypothetical protein
MTSVVSSIIGGEIFGLPRTMADGTDTGVHCNVTPMADTASCAIPGALTRFPYRSHRRDVAGIDPYQRFLINGLCT